LDAVKKIKISTRARDPILKTESPLNHHEIIKLLITLTIPLFLAYGIF
jgi:hypothetical protein